MKLGHFNKPLFLSFFFDFIVGITLPRSYIISKFTKFIGEIEESKVEYIIRYKIERGYIAMNEYLKMKYFLSSLMKNTFTWSTMLTPKSIYN